MVDRVARLHFQPASPAGALRALSGWLIAITGLALLAAQLLRSAEGFDLPVAGAVSGGAMAAAATALGALPLLVVRRIGASVQGMLLGFGAGVMLAASVFALLLPAFVAALAQTASRTGAGVLVGLAVLLGAGGLLALDRALPHTHVPEGRRSGAAVWLFVFAIAVHNVPEGLAIGVAAGLNGSGGSGDAVAAGISLQNVPEGLIVAIALVEAYARAQGLWHDADSPHAEYSATLHLDMGDVQPSLAGPKRPQDRVLLSEMKSSTRQVIEQLTAKRDQRNGDVSNFIAEGGGAAVGNEQVGKGIADIQLDGHSVRIKDGAVVIAAITSCTNTSNPAVMMAAGLLARNAAAKGLTRKPWVKTSLAPGSRVVSEYLAQTGLQAYLDRLGFNIVGFGCTTCIGNSGPLPEAIEEDIVEHDLVACSVLSGNRNFEGRINADVKMNYLASPPLVVAYALAGSTELDLSTEPLGTGSDGAPVYLKDIWPSSSEVAQTIAATIGPEMFRKNYGDVFKGDARWNAIASPDGELYAWDEASTYIKNPPYFEGMSASPGHIADIHGARVLGYFGDSITTDHISPAGSIKKDSPAGRYLVGRGVEPAQFNSYGSRRGNDDVMVRGTFANIRIKNRFFGGEEGGNTLYFGSNPPEKLAIYDAAQKYKADGTPLVVIAGKEYGTGSSRDWAAKGTMLLGVRAVIAESFERIHRSNLIGMGVLPLQFKDGENAQSLGLTGKESFEIIGLNGGAAKMVTVVATPASGAPIKFEVRVRIDTPKEREYYQHGGILHYVLRQLAAGKAA